MAWRSEQFYALPPQEYWLVKPGEFFETPTDDRQIVDVDATIALVKQQIDPSYQWSADRNVHHFEYDENLFPDRRIKGRPNPRVFRELGPPKGILPIDFHGFLHAVLLRPPVPSQEVMHYRIEAWKIAESLFKVGKKAVRKQRLYRRYLTYTSNPLNIVEGGYAGNSEPAQAQMRDRFERWFDGMDRHLEENDNLPKEFRFFDSNAPISQILGDIGKIAVPNSLKLYKAVAA